VDVATPGDHLAADFRQRVIDLLLRDLGRRDCRRERGCKQNREKEDSLAKSAKIAKKNSEN
jgi:hypothetical protein